MPIDIGEIIGTSPSDVLGARPTKARRKSRDESVANFLDEEFLDRATKQARLQFAMTGEARAVAAEERAKAKSTWDETEKILKSFRQVAAQEDFSDDEARDYLLARLGPIADTETGKILLENVPNTAFRRGVSLDETEELVIQSLPEAIRAYALGRKSGLIPPEQNVPAMTAKTFETIAEQVKAESVTKYEGTLWGWNVEGIDPSSKPTPVHRARGLTLAELPIQDISEADIAYTAQQEYRKKFQPDAISNLVQSAFEQALIKQTRFKRQERVQEVQTQTLGELLGPDIPSGFQEMTFSQLKEQCEEATRTGKVDPTLLSLFERALSKMKEQP